MQKHLYKNRIRTPLAILLSVSLCLTVLSPARVFADEDSDFESKMEELNEERDAATERRISAQNKIEELKDEQAAIIDEKIALEERNLAAAEEIELISQQIELVEAEIASYDQKIAEKEKDVEAAKLTEEEQLERYRARVRAMEETGGHNILVVLFNSESLAELLTALDDYGAVMSSDRMLYDQLQEAREEHQRIEEEFEVLRDECETEKKKYENQMEDLQDEVKKLEEQIAEAEALIDEYTQKIEEAEAEKAAAEAVEASTGYAVANFVAEYYRRKNAGSQSSSGNTGSGGSSSGSGSGGYVPDSGSSGGSTGGGSQSSGDGGDLGYIPDDGGYVPDSGSTGGGSGGYVPDDGGSSGGSGGYVPDDGGYSGGGAAEPGPTYSDGQGTGSYVWPFPGHTIITSPFGYRNSTSSYHTGVDIDGFRSGGSPIVAADSGTVIMAQYYGGYGNCIIIDHGNGMSTLYAHLSYMGVSVGSTVSQGQTIGGVGNTGTCYGIDGIHLHFEVMVNGVQTDPLSYLGGYSYTFY